MQTRFSSLAALRAAFAVAGCMLLMPAQGAEYRQLDPAASKIEFSYQQMGVNMDGRFDKFSAELRFDPDAAEAASLRLDVDLASVDTGTEDGNSELATRDWFDTSAFPRASFVASSVKALGDQRYEVSGTLTIKGHSRDVTIPARFASAGGKGVFEGSFTIQRGDFSIGEGAWKAFDIVANDVVIRFHLEAAAE